MVEARRHKARSVLQKRAPSFIVDFASARQPTDPLRIAFDLRTGKKMWSHQLTEEDVWNSGCVAEK